MSTTVTPESFPTFTWDEATGRPSFNRTIYPPGDSGPVTVNVPDDSQTELLDIDFSAAPYLKPDGSEYGDAGFLCRGTIELKITNQGNDGEQATLWVRFTREEGDPPAVVGDIIVDARTDSVTGNNAPADFDHTIDVDASGDSLIVSITKSTDHDSDITTRAIVTIDAEWAAP